MQFYCDYFGVMFRDWPTWFSQGIINDLNYCTALSLCLPEELQVSTVDKNNLARFAQFCCILKPIKAPCSWIAPLWAFNWCYVISVGCYGLCKEVSVVVIELERCYFKSSPFTILPKGHLLFTIAGIITKDSGPFLRLPGKLRCFNKNETLLRMFYFSLRLAKTPKKQRPFLLH